MLVFILLTLSLWQEKTFGILPKESSDTPQALEEELSIKKKIDPVENQTDKDSEQTEDQDENVGDDWLSKPLLDNKNILNISSSLPKEGGLSLIGKAIEIGFNLSGLQDKSHKDRKKFIFNLDSRNDGYNLDMLVSNLTELVKKSRLLLGTFGEDALIHALDWSKKNKTPLIHLFPFAGAESLRSEKDKKLFFFRAPVSKELELLVKYAKTTKLASTAAIFYESSNYGRDALKTLKTILAKPQYRIQSLAEATYSKNRVDILGAVKEITPKKPDVVFCLAHSYPVLNFIEESRKDLGSTLFLGLSSLESVQNVVNKNLKCLILSSTVPNPRKSSLEMAVLYRKYMKEFMSLTPLSTTGFEAFICCKILEEVVKKLSPTATIQDLLSTLENFSGTVLGFDVSFDKNKRSFNSKVWLNDGQEKEWDEY